MHPSMEDAINALTEKLCCKLRFKLPHGYWLKDGLESKSFQADQLTQMYANIVLPSSLHFLSDLTILLITLLGLIVLGTQFC